MPIEYISPGAGPADQNTVYSDTPLSAEMAVAYRRATNPNALTFQVDGPQDFQTLLNMLIYVKNGHAIPQGLRGVTFNRLVQDGYLNEQGQAQNRFKNQIQRNAQVEIIYKVGESHHAVLVMNTQGVAYIDSKGGACPNHQVQIDPKRPAVSFPEFLMISWVQFYDKNKGQSQEELEELAKRSAHLHQNIQQQEKDYDSLDWCLSNLAKFTGDIGANAEALKTVRKPSRADIVDRINTLPNFDLEYRNSSAQEEKKHNWRQKVSQVEASQKEIHTYAVELSNEQKRKGRSDLFRANPANRWVEVFLSVSPQYPDPDKLDEINKYNTKRSTGVTNEFEVKEGNAILAKSKGGEVPYEERFLRLAEDIYAAMYENGKTTSITLKNINPPDKKEECIRAFEKVFGRGNVNVENVESEENLREIPEQNGAYIVGQQPLRH